MTPKLFFCLPVIVWFCFSAYCFTAFNKVRNYEGNSWRCNLFNFILKTVGYLDLEYLSRMCWFAGSVYSWSGQSMMIFTDLNKLLEDLALFSFIKTSNCAAKHPQVAWLVHIVLRYHSTCTWIVWSTNLEELNFPFVTIMAS